MATNNLGTLTLNAVANMGQYDGPIEKSERLTKRAMKEMGIAIDEFGNYTDRNMRKAAEATKQLDAQFEVLSQSMQSEIALYGDVSRAAQLRYDLEKGALKNLSEEQKKTLTEMASRLSALDNANAAFKEQAALMEKAARETQQLDSKYENLESSMQRQITLYGQVSRAAQLRYDLEKGALKNLSEEQKKTLTEMALRLDALDEAGNQAGGSLRGFRGVATGLGYQVQDIAVQLQAGTNAFMVLGQQGSQIASLFGPYGAVVGAVIAVGGAIAGALIPNLLKTGDTAEETADRVAQLITELNDLDEAQKKLVLTAQGYNIDDQTKKYEEQRKAIEAIKKEIEDINKLPDRPTVPLSVSMGTGGLAAGSTPELINKTEALADATRRLNAAQIERLETARQIAELQDPTGGAEAVENLRLELELIGLTGEALHKKVAEQKGYTEGLAIEYVALKLLIEEKEKEIEAEKKLEKERDAARKRQEEQEKSRKESVDKAIKALEREADLYGVTSRAAQAEYDILKQNVKILDGINSAEGTRYMMAARRLDQLDAEKNLNEALNLQIDERINKQIENEKSVEKILENLREQEAQLRMNSASYVELELRAKDATEAQIQEAVSRAQSIETLKANAKQVEQFFERLDQAAANVWVDFLEGSSTAMESLKKLFLNTLAELAHAAITRPIVVQIQQQFSAMSGGGGAGSLLGAAGGWMAAGAVAVVAAVDRFNKEQEERVKEFTSEYRQGVQSTGTLLGMANAKSESIAKAIEGLESVSDDTLNVNHDMYKALVDIRTGIAGVAAGFARQLGINDGVAVPNISTGTDTINPHLVGAAVLGPIYAVSQLIGGQIGGFVDSIVGGLAKAVYSKKKKVVDTGISFGQQTLSDILVEGAVSAMGYASVNVKKKFLGVTTSNKTKDTFSGLDDAILDQFGDVFGSAGAALGQAASVFGLDFEKYIDQLILPAQKLSLKDLEGEELTAEIEKFFSSTLDNWAGVLVQGSTVLEQFQRVGEGAFETVIRLASELNTFNAYADMLNLNFNATGVVAIETAQKLAELSGGFDNLTSRLSSYYENFFTEQERVQSQIEQLNSTFAEMGITEIPKTREEFRKLVESLSAITDQEKLAGLLGIQDAFSNIMDFLDEEAEARAKAAEDLAKAAQQAAEEAARAAEEAARAMRERIGNAFSKLSESVESERKRIEEANEKSVTVLNASLDKHRALADALRSSLGSMSLESERYSEIARRQAQAQVIAANAIAKAGGPLPSLEALAPALEALSRPSTDMFSTFEDYARDFYTTQRNLKELEQQAEKQVSADEQALVNQEKYYQEEISRLDKILSYYEKQIDLLDGIDVRVLTVAQAISELNSTLTGSGRVGILTKELNPSSLSVATVQAETFGSVLTPSVDKTYTDLLLEVKSLRADLADSQYNIAKNTQRSANLLERWETDGLPPEREEL